MKETDLNARYGEPVELTREDSERLRLRVRSIMPDRVLVGQVIVQGRDDFNQYRCVDARIH